MERLRCKTCGCESMTPMEVMLEDQEADLGLLGGEQESRFYSCHVCGDNWLVVKETGADGGDCTVTFVHQMGMSPVLKRVGHMQTPVIINNDTVEEWEYFLGNSPVAEETWHNKLQDRRQVLKSICTN